MSTEYSTSLSPEETLISQTVKNGLKKSFNYSYETTTGLEGCEYFTKEYNEANCLTKQYKDLIIRSRKADKLVCTMKIKEVTHLNINNNLASATAIYNATGKGRLNKLNFNNNGEIKV